MNQGGPYKNKIQGMTRRDFFRRAAGGLFVPYLASFPRFRETAGILNDVFWVKNIPHLPFADHEHENYHIGLDSLLYLMAGGGLKFYRSSAAHPLNGPLGLIAPDDVVLIKVNAQWKYRGCTNSDLVRGLIQRILDHPDGFSGEVIIFENGQGRGSLKCNTSSAYGDSSVHANANDEKHSFLYLVDQVFRDPRVSAFLLDPIRDHFIEAKNHVSNGYRRYENVSYPCFTTAGGRRVELREGVWQGTGYGRNLKLINVPVLKHHDTGGSEITASLKHFYGVVSMADGQSGFRHYSGLGETCGKMMASVATPVLNIVDAIWVCHSSLRGCPEATTFRANEILASQDPVAADYYAAKHILYPINGNFRHHPDFAGVERWLVRARDTINNRGGLRDLDKGIIVDRVTKNESEMNVQTCDASSYLGEARIAVSPDSLSFLASARAPRMMEKSFSIALSGSVPYGWRVEKDVNWLSLMPAWGSGNGVVSVRANAAGLDSGRYTGNIRIFCREAVNSPLFMPVRLNVVELRGRRLLRSPRD